ncbi:MAG: glutamate formimidoyltransferase [candidate division WOR-3 bacterium]
MKLIECIPNFSEGRNKNKIEEIIKEVEKTSGVFILDVHSGFSTNRTVLTMVGTPKGIEEAAFKLYRKASELIDMRNHRGVHPRIGAIDVCPFIPIKNTKMEECIKIAKSLGEKVAEELKIPVYLYGKASSTKEREDLSTIRKFEYEGLKERIHLPFWKPDFGEAKMDERKGATLIGARDLLIAFNINLNTKDKRIASEIAGKIRESGFMKVSNGRKVRVPGKLKGVRAIGWYIEELGCAQVSSNLTDFKKTPLYLLFEEVKKEAEKLCVEVRGSELVGLIPEEALIESGKFYSKGRNSLRKKELIEIAINCLGLSEKEKFEPNNKILEYKLKNINGYFNL